MSYALNGGLRAAGVATPFARRKIAVLAGACGIAVANANYAQPLLVSIGQSLGLAGPVVGLIPALTQFGVAAGVLLLLPLGDVISVRRLLTVTIILQAIALLATSLAPGEAALLLSSALIGFFGITPYVLPPYATLNTPPERRGRVTALLAQGVLIGMLLARTVSGVIGLHFGWRTVYAMAAALMLALLIPLRQVIQPEAATFGLSYSALMRSLVHVSRAVPVLRWSALCQALSTGSFTTLWIGITFHMQSPVFGWRSDGVGALALIGAAAAMFAPFVGAIADRTGPRRSLLFALFAVLLAWTVLAAFGDRLAGVIVGMIMLDMGATAADISNRTIIFGLSADIRTRLTTVYMVAKFTGAGLMAWLASMAWTVGDWPAVCALGAVAAGLAVLTAWLGIGRSLAQGHSR